LYLLWPGCTNHLHQPVGEDTTQARRKEPNGIEGSDALLQVIPCVPRGDEVDAAGQEAAFEDAQDEAEAGESLPVAGEAEADLPYQISTLSWMPILEGLLTRRMPQARVVAGKKILAPIFRQIIVAGGSDRINETKKTSAIVD